MSRRSVRTLISIDDNEVDQMLYERLVQRSGLADRLRCFQYAEHALDYLQQEGLVDVDAILLDINMPRMNGFEFLEEAERLFGDDFADVVVVLLTTSLAPIDESRARRYDVVKASYRKPLSETHLTEIANLVERRCTASG